MYHKVSGITRSGSIHPIVSNGKNTRVYFSGKHLYFVVMIRYETLQFIATCIYLEQFVLFAPMRGNPKRKKYNYLFAYENIFVHALRYI